MLAPCPTPSTTSRDKLRHPERDVRIRAALDLGEHPKGHEEADSLIDALEDHDPAVVEAVSNALDRIVAAHPEVVGELVKVAGDESETPSVAMVRYLVHLGTPQAIEGALAAMVGEGMRDHRRAVVEMLVTADGLTNERLHAILDDADADDQLRQGAAEILGRRGIPRGYEVLFDEYATRFLVDEYVARGPEGIRIMCRAVPEPTDWHEEIPARLAAHRKKTEATIVELAEDPASGGDRMAVRVLGYWDEPHIVQRLLRMAEDPAPRRELREEALEALGRLEAPEAMELLIHAMLDPKLEDVTRWHCADALGAIGNPGALEALQAVATEDPDKTLRERAQEAIVSIEQPG